MFVTQVHRIMNHKKIAVVLMNLGGPTHPNAIHPFLFNLFKDPCIIPLPAIVRYPLAWLISTLRTKKAQKIYAALGGGSPLNHHTQTQAQALEDALIHEGLDVKCFMCMRYAPPMTEDCVEKVRAYQPDHVALLPLYPQFSTTTTKSSFLEWDNVVKNDHFHTLRRCCYPVSAGFIRAMSSIIQSHLSMQKSDVPLRIVFSAHGIPMDCIEKRGDPYEDHVQKTVHEVMRKLNADTKAPLDHTLCYQSRVGPKKWLTPTLDQALIQCKDDQRGAVVVPIAFVSDHSETLVELDIQYKEVADQLGLAHYSRVPALNDHPLFIEFLKDEVVSMLNHHDFERICPQNFQGCGYRTCLGLSACGA